MTIFGKILAVLNFLAVLGLAFLAARDYTARQAWVKALEEHKRYRDGLATEELKKEQPGLDPAIDKHSDARQRSAIARSMYEPLRAKLEKLAEDTLTPEEKEALLKETEELAKNLSDKVGAEGVPLAKPLKDKLEKLKERQPGYEEKVKLINETQTLASELAAKLGLDGAELYEPMKLKLERLKAPTLEEKDQLEREAKELATKLSPAPYLQPKLPPRLNADDFREIVREHVKSLEPRAGLEIELANRQKLTTLRLKDSIRAHIQQLEDRKAFLEVRLDLEKDFTKKVDGENEQRKKELAQLYVELEEAIAARNLANAREQDMLKQLEDSKRRRELLTNENQRVYDEIEKLERKLAKPAQVSSEQLESRLQPAKAGTPTSPATPER